ncbi:MAG: MFS transporter [Erysipelotrichaceae bacterium]|nr:MFS transporter [Erysipelotrichaceae bacterium]
MTKNEILCILCNALYTLTSGMSAVFMNVFLYTYTGSLIVMVIYTCIHIALMPICFTIAGKIALKMHYGITLSIGLVFLVIQLLFVLYYNELFAIYHYYVYIVAIFFGIGEGFYYLSLNTLHQLVTTPHSRSLFIGVGGVLNNIASVVAPLLATFIIDVSMDDMSGYINIFKIVVVVFIFMSVLALLINVKGNPTNFSVIKSISFQNDQQWKYILMSNFLFGFRDSLVLALSGLLVYNATNGSGSLYGKLLACFAFLTILSYMFVSKTMVRTNRMKYYTLGAIFLSTSTIVLVVFPNIYGAIYYGVVNAIASAFYSSPFNLIAMNALNDYDKQENIVGRVIAREIYLTISRCLGMLFIVFCNKMFSEMIYLYVSVITLSLSPIALAAYSNRYHKKRDAMKSVNQL